MKHAALYICRLLNIEADEVVAARIAAALNQYNNVSNFVSFVEQNLNHIDLAYKNSIQKFFTLQELYSQAELAKRELEIEGEANELIHTALSFFRKLDYHVRVENKDPRDRGVDKALTKYFSEYQLNILSKIGQREKLIQLAVNHPDALAEQIRQIMREQALAMLIKPQAQALALEEQTINKRVLTLLKPSA